MARPHPLPFTARIAFEGVNELSRWANIFWIKWAGTDPPSVAQVNQVAAQLGNAYATTFLTHLTNSLILETTKAVFFTDNPDVVVEGESVANVPGSDATGIRLPASSACVVSWLSNVYWRGGKPRTYIPGLTNAMTDTNRSFTPAFQSSMKASAEQFRTDVNQIATSEIVSVTLGLQSFFSKDPTKTRPAFFPFTGAQVGRRIDSQRRRLGVDET